MIGRILDEEIKERRLSYRQAAQEIGIAHTTVIRICRGLQSDLSSLEKVSTWLGVELASIITPGPNINSRLLSQLAMFFQRNPTIARAFEDCLDRVENGEIKPRQLEEVIMFITFVFGAKRV